MAESAGALPTPVVAPDERTLFTHLTRPLPSYALEHIFSAHGPVEWVRVLPHITPGRGLSTLLCSSLSWPWPLHSVSHAS